MTTPLQTALKAALDKWDSNGLISDSGMEALRKALEAEQAQAVEPVYQVYIDGGWHDKKESDMWLYAAEQGWSESDVRKVYLHPAPPSYGQQALITEEASLRFNLTHYKEQVSELENDVRELKTQLARRTVERDMAISMAAGVEAQQVAVPDGWALVPIEPTPAILGAMLSSGCNSPSVIYKAMLAAAQGAKP